MENLINTLINDLSLNDSIQEIILEVNPPDISNLSNVSIITRELRQNNRITNSLRENRIISFAEMIENIQNFNLRNEDFTIIDQDYDINNFINSTINDKNKYKKVITDIEFEKLETTLYNKNTNKSNKCCPIYYLDFDNNDKIIQLPCKHIFFSEAIEKWLKEESNMCPVCRYSFDYKEIVNSDSNSDNSEQQNELNNEQQNELNNENNDESIQ